MLAQTFLSYYQYENELIKTIKKSLPEGKNHASHIFEQVVGSINTDLRAQKYTRDLAVRVRLAIKLYPYSTEIGQLMGIYNTVLRHVLAPNIAPVLETIYRCEQEKLPVPLIISCKRYITKALELQEQFRDRYFGITPIVIKGDITTPCESHDGRVLTLPVDDSYEALPVKVLESAVFMQAFATKVGFMKIDDDVNVLHGMPSDMQVLRDAFAATDYMGNVMDRSLSDGTWHVGKCMQNVPAIHAKPFKAMWPRGAFYYLSNNALNKLATHYMRYPSILDGEFYEDKVVSGILYDNNIMATHFILENAFNCESSSPERLINPNT